MAQNPFPHIFVDPEPASAEGQHPFFSAAATPTIAQPHKGTAAVPARQAKPAVWYDFVVVLLACPLLVGIVYSVPALPGLALPRLFIALIFLLFVPGYCLASALFPRRDDLDGIERAGMSMGLSVALAPVVALVLDRTGLGLDLSTIMPTFVGVSLCLMALALILRMRLPGETAFAPAPGYLARFDWRAALILGSTLAAALGVVAWLYLSALNPPKTTEFYLLGPGGLAEDYPRRTLAGQPVTVTIGVSSYERAEELYTIEVLNHGDLIGLSGPHLLKPGEIFQAPIEFYPLHAGDDQAFTFLLRRGDDEQPYRILELWLDVAEIEQ